MTLGERDAWVVERHVEIKSDNAHCGDILNAEGAPYELDNHLELSTLAMVPRVRNSGGCRRPGVGVGVSVNAPAVF